MTLDTGHLHISPLGFQLAAQDYFKCYLDFQKPRKHSSVPFFLCCRAIELALKSIHLETSNSQDMKDNYRHNIEKLYSNLPPDRLDLSSDEIELLKKASAIYKEKDFEYFSAFDAATGYTRFPDLNALAKLARKVTGYPG